MATWDQQVIRLPQPTEVGKSIRASLFSCLWKSTAPLRTTRWNFEQSRNQGRIIELGQRLDLRPTGIGQQVWTARWKMMFDLRHHPNKIVSCVLLLFSVFVGNLHTL